MIRNQDRRTLRLCWVEVTGGSEVGSDAGVEGVGGVVGVGVVCEAGDVVGCGGVGLDGRDRAGDDGRGYRSSRRGRLWLMRQKWLLCVQGGCRRARSLAWDLRLAT